MLLVLVMKIAKPYHALEGACQRESETLCHLKFGRRRQLGQRIGWRRLFDWRRHEPRPRNWLRRGRARLGIETRHPRRHSQAPVPLLWRIEDTTQIRRLFHAGRIIAFSLAASLDILRLIISLAFPSSHDGGEVGVRVLRRINHRRLHWFEPVFVQYRRFRLRRDGDRRWYGRRDVMARGWARYLA